MTTQRDSGMTILRIGPERARGIVSEYFHRIDEQGIEAAVDYLQCEILRVAILEPMVRELEAMFRALAEGASSAALGRGSGAAGGVVGRSCISSSYFLGGSA